MRIGILTFHRACNYGAVLQCYALQQFLVSEGHDVEVVDYRQRDVERVYAVFRPWHWIKQVLRCRKYAFVYLYRIPQRIRAKVSFGLFLSKYLKLSKPCTLADMPQGYDLYVIGSDQLWNQHITWGIDQVYWGNFDAGNAKLITYAVSSSMKCFEKIDHRYIKESIKRFSAISCREKCLCDYLNASVEGASAVQVLDPTLMADRSVWEEFNDDSFSHKPYVLVYHAGRVGKNKELYKKANEMARLLNCEVVNITKGSYSVEQFVSLFRYATCVVTTSFHAVAFSIIFERPLYAMQLHDGHDSRYVDLLNCIGAQDLLVETDFEPQYRQPDYSVVRTRLADLVEKSRSFLRNQW